MNLVDIIIHVTPYARYVPQDTVIQVNEHVLTIGPNGVRECEGACPKYMIKVSEEPDSIIGGIRDGKIKVFNGSTDVGSKIAGLLSVLALS